jgi:23S rRNA pseudouridine2605 synthase
MQIRLQKFLSQAGLGSRRKAEQMIEQGLVSVNGEIITHLGSKVDPKKDVVFCQGEQVKITANKTVTMLLYKPKGFLSTLSDPEGRPTIQHFLAGIPWRLFPVGRLDFNSEGILLLTNDGELAFTLTHPKHHLPKIYLVKVRGVPDKAKLQRLRHGIKLAEGLTAPAQVKLLETTKTNCWLKIALREGKNRQIRRMGDAIGHPVLKLKRVGVAFLDLGNLAPGQYRWLTHQEVRNLKKLADNPNILNNSGANKK